MLRPGDWTLSISGRQQIEVIEVCVLSFPAGTDTTGLRKSKFVDRGPLYVSRYQN